MRDFIEEVIDLESRGETREVASKIHDLVNGALQVDDLESIRSLVKESLSVPPGHLGPQFLTSLLIVTRPVAHKIPDRTKLFELAMQVVTASFLKEEAESVLRHLRG